MTDAAELYQALLVSGRIPGLRQLTYRCDRHRCLLLDAIETPLGVVLHQLRFKQSEAVNLDRSNEAGRAKNTYDGANHWRPRTYFLNQSALKFDTDPHAMLGIQCDHVGVLPDGGTLSLTGPEFANDWNARHAEVRIRRDGSRYAV